MHALVAFVMHLRTIVKPLPKCGRHVTDKMQPNTHDHSVKWSVLGPWLQYLLLIEVTLKLGTLVFVCVGCYRMLSTPLNNVLVTMRHVTTLINCELRIVAFRRSRTIQHTTRPNGEPRRAKMI